MDKIHFDMLYHSSCIRGFIINAMTMLERTMDYFMAKHFCGSSNPKEISKAEQLMNRVLATKHITFENKRIIFDGITSSYYPEYKKEHLINLHAELDKFNKVRNSMAHYVIEYSPESISHFLKTQEITFLKFERAIDKIFYSSESSLAYAAEISKFVEPVGLIIQIRRALPPQRY
jgi:hypothetical protein